MANKVGERFQITIDKAIREQLGVRPGDQAIEWTENGVLMVGFVRPNNDSMLGIVKRMTGREIEPITDWQALYDRAWAVRSAEIMEVLAEDSRRHQPVGDQTDKSAT
jgi:AbrB family looped-hinge helix DNA binding protein